MKVIGGRSMGRYVQHISGQGKLWELASDGRVCNQQLNHPTWVVCENAGDHGSVFYLPKSEYRLVEPPEKWVDVTKEISYDEHGHYWGHAQSDRGFSFGGHSALPKGYRLRKIVPGLDKMEGLEAFIIEKREV